jgi:exosortase E/protease (VPEID-CTERM system)
VGACALLAAEGFWLTSTFQAPDASAAPQWGLLLSVFNEGHHYTALILFTAVFLLVASATANRTLRVLSRQNGYTWWPSAILHGIALFAFAGLTSLGFGTTTGSPDLSWAWLVAWILAAAGTLGTWLLIIAPARAWILVLRLQWLNLVIALGGAAAVWLGGLLVQGLWRPLAGGTLRLSALLLSLVYPEMTYDPARGLVGSDAYMVEITYQCSGYEGIALVTVFVGAYLWIFRKALPFPRAFLLLPIGIVSIWLTNVLRVSALIVIGTSVSPEVAGRGFHSQAGWIAFTLVALGSIALSHRWLTEREGHATDGAATRARPELALLLPLMALMATTMVTAAASAGFDTFYPLGVLVTGAVLWHYRAAYRPLFGPLTWEPFAIGAGVFVLWALLVPGGSAEGLALASRLSEWSAWLAAGWLLFRVLGSVITVPLAEELAFRGYLIRKLVAKDFERVRPGHFTWFSFILSSVLFGLLHQNLVAGALAGAAFALALYRRGRVGDAILAHMTSNALIAVAVLAAGRWGLWA